MKTASANLLTALDQEHAVKTLPRLIAEWNLNRYYTVQCDNIPDEDSSGFDIEMFPIESIGEPNRPAKGINKARVDEARAGGGYADPRPARFYVADYDDQYKYWTSPEPSDSSGVMPVWSVDDGGDGKTVCRPYVVYATEDSEGVLTYTPVQTNKIVVKFENSWATPSEFAIEIRKGGDWIQVFTQTSITSSEWEKTGEFILYYKKLGAPGEWRQNHQPLSTDLETITGVRVTVTKLKGGVEESGAVTKYSTASSPNTLIPTDGKNSHCNVIEISARREVDLTTDLISVDDSFDIADSSNLYPIGTLTTNTGSLTLWNGEGTYNTDNPDSPLKNLLEPNVELRLFYDYYLDSGVESIPHFLMYSGEWSNQSDDEVTVEFGDYSKFFQETTPRQAMWENLTIPQIIYRLCDSIGFTKYKISTHSAVTNFRIPVFWTDGEKNMWEVLDDLANASQTAIYFDGMGVLQCKTREAAFDEAKSKNYTLRGQKDGSELANIISMDQTTAYEANTVKVSYQKTRWSDFNNGQPTLQTVWEPEDTTALRSTPLAKPLGIDDAMFYISTRDIKFWHYKGLVNINGEIIRYDGLEFAYYTYVGTTATRNVAVVKSAEELEEKNLLTPEEYRYQNALTGGLKVVTRGEWNTEKQAHTIDADGYAVRHFSNGVRKVGPAGFIHYPTYSSVRLRSPSTVKRYDDMTIATKGAAVDSAYWFYGTRIRLQKGMEKGFAHQRGGLALHNDGTGKDDGYYIEIMPTSKVNATTRKVRNELVFITRKNGKNKYIGKGAKVAIGENIWYDMDVSFEPISGGHKFKVWINGKLCLTVNVTGANVNTYNGRFGMFASGKSNVAFQYLYALRRQETDPPDDFSFLDKQTGGYVSKLWNHEWVYRIGTKTRIVKKKSSQVTYKQNEKFFDEFGPYVHEIREFDVKFDPNPVLHSRLFLTNDWCAAVLEYNPTPFGAKFVLANIARIHAIVHGEDTLTFPGTEDSVNQVLNVFGRPLVIDEAEEKEYKHEEQVRRRGAIEVELTSEWLQSEEAADAVGNWIIKNMSYGNDELSVEVFGNTLFEIADVVEINYTKKNMNGVKYFVTAVSNIFEGGLSTNLTLRRVNPASIS